MIFDLHYRKMEVYREAKSTCTPYHSRRLYAHPFFVVLIDDQVTVHELVVRRCASTPSFLLFFLFNTMFVDSCSKGDRMRLIYFRLRPFSSFGWPEEP